MKRIMACIAALAGSLLALSVTPAAAPAQTYPDRPIRIIVGFAPGGSSDVVARLVAQRLQPLLGQPVVVENRPGAGGLIGAEYVARSPADGHTLLLVAAAHVTSAAMVRKLAFEPVGDFAWITFLTTYPFVIATGPQSPFKSLPEVIAAAKTAPGKLTYSSVGVGSAGHLLGEWVAAEAGVQLVHIPFRGGTSPLTEVMAGRVDLMFDTITITLPQIQSGNLRALAVSSKAPAQFLPGVPTVAQAVPGVVFQSWLGIAAPGGTPPDVVARLNQDLRRVLAEPEVQQRLADLGGVAAPVAPEAMRAQVAAEIAMLQRLVDSRGIARQ